MTVVAARKQMSFRPRRPRPRGDGDWLSLIEPVGQFLTAPVVRAAFPEGLPAVPAELRSDARERLADDGADPDQSHGRAAWIDWLLRVALGWGDLYDVGAPAAAVSRDIPEYRTTLRADGVLRDPTGSLRAIVVQVPRGTRFDARQTGEEWSATPLDRIAELARAHRVAIALLTDGERVALVNVPIAKSDTPTDAVGGYAIWHTNLFAEGAERDYFAAFVALLHAQHFFNATDRDTLEALFERSALTQADLTKTLGLQVRKAVELMIGAFSRSDRERRGEILDALAPHTVYEAAATVMMRLVFLLYAEERDLLPIGDPTYAEFYAVSTLRDQLEADAIRLGDEPLERRATAWRRLLATFNAIYAGIDHDRLRLPRYGGRLFDPARFAFLERCRVDDLTTRAILTSLQTVTLSGESRRLSFLALDVEQIGHVYEGLLDHDAVRVSEIHLGFDGKSGTESEIPLAEIERIAGAGRTQLIAFLAEKLGRSEKAVENGLAIGEKLLQGEDPETRRLVMTTCESDESLVRRTLPYAPLLRDDLQGLPTIYPAGHIIVTKTRARRDSGTEYTPRVLSEEIVRYALEPLVYSPGPIDGAARETWLVKPSSDLLALKICDPTCGSGAFLVAACRYLAKRVSEAWKRERHIIDDDPIRDAQRIITERCLYGVDRDPMAVEMAKLSLWLLTFARQKPFGFLDHSIREGDSLLGITSIDQLDYLHIDPAVGHDLHKRALVDVTAVVQPLVRSATSLRREIVALPSISIHDVEEKSRLNDEVSKLLDKVEVVADGIIATSLFTALLTEAKRKAAFQGLASIVANAINASVGSEQQQKALDQLRSRNQKMLNSERPDSAPPRKPLHWRLVFPEVFEGVREGFDAIVGNPPFMGGKKISGAFGQDYRQHLVLSVAEGRKGNANLVCYFFARSSRIALSMGLIATDKIANQESREVGLTSLIELGWRITAAVRSKPWPGEAGVHIAQIWLSQKAPQQRVFCEGTEVKGISANLLPVRRIDWSPRALNSNSRLAYQGVVVLSLGFIISHEEAARLIEVDPRNRQVLFPFLITDDVCSQPYAQASRWAISFFNKSIDEAQSYPEVFEIVETRVKPERQRLDSHGAYVLRKPLPQRWWQYAEKRPALFSAIAGLNRVIVMPLTSKIMLPVMLRSDFMFDQTLVVIASQSLSLFAVLSSELHRSWAIEHGGAHGVTPRYTHTACFETFPFPPEKEDLQRCGQSLTELQSGLMGSGLTALYNRFHDPSDTSEDVSKLRAIHVEIDYAVCEAYNWSGLALQHGFHETDEGIRWTICGSTKSEILDRLLELNQFRHAEEVKVEAAPSTGARRGAKGREKLTIIGEGKLELFGHG